MKTGILARAFLLSTALALLVGLVRGGVESALLMQEAERYRARKEYARAINICQQLIMLDPQWSLPHLRLGQMYLVQGRLNEAEEEFTQAWDLDREEDDALLGLGLVAYHRGDIEQAVVYWHEASARNPGNIDVHYWLGRTYLESSQFEMAERELKCAALEDGSHQEAHYYLGLLLADKDTTLAAEHLNLAAGGNDPELSRRAQEMILLLEEAAASRGEAHVAALLGHAYIRYEMPSLALAQLERVVALQPDDYAARAYLGYVLFALGEHEEARDVLREVTRVAPKYPLGHYFLAMLHRSEGYLPTALWEFKTSLHRDPSNAAVYADIADTYQRMGLYLVAAEWYRAAVEVAPDEPSFRLLLAQFYVDVLLRAEEGLTAARQAAALAPSNPLAQDLLGWARYLAGDSDRALVALERAISLDPDFARAFYHLGVVYTQMGDEEKAQWAYRRAIDLDSDGLYRQRAMTELDEG